MITETVTALSLQRSSGFCISKCSVIHRLVYPEPGLSGRVVYYSEILCQSREMIFNNLPLHKSSQK